MKIGLVITCFNRPEYFSQCLDSLRKTNFKEHDLFLVIVDDASTDGKTLDLIHNFSLDGVPIIKKTNLKNSSVSYSLKYGFETCFDNGCDVVINLDSDAIVKPLFIDVLIGLYKRFPDNIITGFNCRTKNKDGKDRHEIIAVADSHFVKKSVGGINMCMGDTAFRNYMRPALEKVLAGQGNWDHLTCIAAFNAGYPVIVSSPSVVQHIGFNSSMGHYEEPDTAQDFFSLELPEVSIVCVDSDSKRGCKALDYSCRDIKFGDWNLITSGGIKSKEDYSNFIMKKLFEYIKTDFVLIVQHDGYVLNYQAWDPDFLKYDYIGASWWYKDNMNVGNGGFSLRSKKLMEILATDPHIKELHPEDHHICRTYRKYLEEKYNIKFAPEELANKFSIESANSPDKKYKGQFGFHGYDVDFSGTGLVVTKPQKIEEVKKPIQKTHTHTRTIRHVR